MNRKALIVVDMQNDFITGSLAVPNAHEIIPVINGFISDPGYAKIIFTQDWHPESHISFKEWPRHCVGGCLGAEIHSDVNTLRADLIIRKGVDKDVDSYSAFMDDNGKLSGLCGYLRDCKITEVFIVGLATDYCVKYTALDSRSMGFDTHLLTSACRTVGLKTGDRAIKEMKGEGVIIHE